MAKHTREELYQWQALPLSVKISMTKQRIRDWVNEFGLDGVYVSFSGGKDSSVLLHIAREMYGNSIKAVFIDTGLEYPEIRELVKTYENVDWVRPKKHFRQVCEEYGFPLISKEVSECVYGAKKYLTSILDEMNASTNERTNERSTLMLSTIENSEELANILDQRMQNREGGSNQRLAIMLGMLTKDQRIKANIPNRDRSMFAQEKWKFFLEAPFDISNRCCNVMKKEPAHRYAKETGRKPMTAQMASESKLRTQKWLKSGCNAFDSKNPISNPMSFWTEQDVLLYIVTHGIEIASVYGDIVIDYEKMGQIEGQMSVFDFMGDTEQEKFAPDREPLKTTECQRTGCVFCGFGCHLEKGESRFQRLKRTHPKHYKAMANIKNNGVNYFEAIDWINEHNGKGEIIKY